MSGVACKKNPYIMIHPSSLTYTGRPAALFHPRMGQLQCQSLLYVIVVHCVCTDLINSSSICKRFHTCFYDVPINGYEIMNIFKCISMKELLYFIKISQKCVLRGSNWQISALVQVIAWARTGAKLLPEQIDGQCKKDVTPLHSSYVFLVMVTFIEHCTVINQGHLCEVCCFFDQQNDVGYHSVD